MISRNSVLITGEIGRFGDAVLWRFLDTEILGTRVFAATRGNGTHPTFWKIMWQGELVSPEAPQWESLRGARARPRERGILRACHARASSELCFSACTPRVWAD